MTKRNVLVGCGVLVAALSVVSSWQNAYADLSVPGNLQTDIIGGVDVQSDDPIASSTVMLFGQITDNGQQGVYICSASILSNDTLVTAAHCVAEDTTNPTAANQLVVIFAQTLPGSFDGSDAQAIMTSSVAQPIYGYEYAPGWQGASSPTINQPDFHDLAVIRFKGGLPQGYAPATLLASDDMLTQGAEVTLAGYGITSSKDTSGKSAGTLRKVNVTIQGPYGQTEEQVTGTKRKDMCSGDSGGPAFLSVNGQLQLWGATSRGDSTCSTGGIYTLINAYTDFIAGAEADLEKLQ